MLDFGFYNMDCMKGMKEYPDKYFNLAIVDPPYGININNNMGRRKGDKKSDYPKAYWDKKPVGDDYFSELFRVSKKAIIWGGELLFVTASTVLHNLEKTAYKRKRDIFNVRICMDES